jgi:hypothetical protein
MTGYAGSTRAFLLGIAFGSAALAALGYLQLRSVGADVRLEPVAQLDARLASGATLIRAVGTPAAQDAFRRRLAEAGFRRDSVSESAGVVRLQTWIGDRVLKAGPPDEPVRGYDLLVHAERGGGLLCGGMSDVLREALVLLGIRARTVQLYESLFWRPFTHVVVEAFVEGDWRVFDPTFNVTYESDGRVLGVLEIQDRLRTLPPDAVRAVFHGPRAYPASLEREGRGWRRMFANAYVSDVGRSPDALTGLPPWRYWTGPTIYYYGDQPWLFPAEHQRVYFCVTVALPAVALLAGLAALVLSRRKIGAQATLTSRPPSTQ